MWTMSSKWQKIAKKLRRGNMDSSWDLKLRIETEIIRSWRKNVSHEEVKWLEIININKQSKEKLIAQKGEEAYTQNIARYQRYFRWKDRRYMSMLQIRFQCYR
jgi:hypothetical protein